MEDTRLFVSTSREENRDYLIYPNTILGVFDGEKLIAYGSLVFPNDSPENIGWDLDWSREKIFHCLTLDTIVVDPDYRGHGLQRAPDPQLRCLCTGINAGCLCSDYCISV